MLGQGNPLEEGTGTHSSVLAWTIPWTEEAGGGGGVSVPSTVWFKKCAKTVVLNHEDTSDVGDEKAAFRTCPFDLLMGNRSEVIRQICKPKEKLKIEVWKGGNIPYYLQVEKMEEFCRVTKNKTWSWLWLFQFLIEKFKLKLKKVGKTSRPYRYDLNRIPCDYTVKVTNRFEGLDLVGGVPEELWIKRFVTWYRGQWQKPSQRERNARWQSGAWRGFTHSGDKKTSRSEGERERYTQLSAESQGITRRN